MEAPLLFDSHAHYDDTRFDADRDALLDGMAQAGVGRILCCASDLASGDVCCEIASRHANVWASAGVHPHEAAHFNPAEGPLLRAQLARPKCVALGEIGLDYSREGTDRALQQAVFNYQLALARAVDKPIIVHDRDAHGDTLDALREAGCRGVIHCYSGSVEMARELVSLGYFLSFTGVITFPNARKSLDVIRAVPRERLMIETDAPYLTPVPYRGKRNDSRLVRYTCQAMADALGLSFEETAALTARNAIRCFELE